MSEINNGGPAMVLHLENGSTALVSKEDKPLVGTRKWRLGANGYVYRVGARKAGVQCLLHRIIAGAKRGEDVHHINGIKTDCRRENLNVLSPSDHQEHHKQRLIERNRMSRRYGDIGKCKVCQVEFIKDPDHRGRQTCCSKRCACLSAVAARKAK